jgi:small subunit ribosomal protein S20
MPIKHAGKKAQRASKTRRQSNGKQKESLKEILKKTTEKNINLAFKAIDKAAKNNLLHRNKANRMKSQLSKKFSTNTTSSVKNVKTVKKTAKPKTIKKTSKK